MPAPRRVVVKRAPAKKAPVRRRAPTTTRRPMNKYGDELPYSARVLPKRAVRKAKGSSSRSALGTILGTALGGMLGGPGGAGVGGMVGNAGGQFLSKIFGHGDYQVSNMASVSQNSLSNAANIPQFGTGKVACNFKHREFLGDVISSATANTFQITKYSVNPGLVGTFPWLSQVVGSSFQQYRINGMMFEYRTMSADALNSVNTALGQVIMAADYDSADVAFTTKQQMENTEYGVSCKPSVNMCHAIECARSQTSISEQYVRAFAVPSTADIRFYDLCQFYIATNGMQGTSVNCGELWVTYDIDCFKAIEQPPGFQQPFAQYAVVLATAATQPLTINTTPLASGLPANFDNIGLTVDATGLILTFPVNIPNLSVWQVLLHQTATSGGAAAVTVATMNGSNGMNSLNLIGGTRISEPNPSPGPATQRGMDVIGWFQYTNPGTGALPTITFVASTVPFTTYSGSEFMVTMLPGNVPHL